MAAILLLHRQAVQACDIEQLFIAGNCGQRDWNAAKIQKQR
jgi:hypothetical protein